MIWIAAAMTFLPAFYVVRTEKSSDKKIAQYCFCLLLIGAMLTGYLDIYRYGPAPLKNLAWCWGWAQFNFIYLWFWEYGHWAIFGGLLLLHAHAIAQIENPCE